MTAAVLMKVAECLMARSRASTAPRGKHRDILGLEGEVCSGGALEPRRRKRAA